MRFYALHILFFSLALAQPCRSNPGEPVPQPQGAGGPCDSLFAQNQALKKVSESLAMAFFDVLQDATISVQNRPLILQSRKFGEFTLDTTESSTNIGHSYLAMQAQGALLVLKVIAAKPDCCPRTFYTHITTHFTAGTSPELIKMTDIHLRMAVAKLIVDKIDFTQTPHKSNLLWMVHNVSDRDTVDEFYTELGFSRVVQAGNKHIVYYYASPDDDDDGDYNAVYDPQPFQPEHAGDPNLVLATQ